MLHLILSYFKLLIFVLTLTPQEDNNTCKIKCL